MLLYSCILRPMKNQKPFVFVPESSVVSLQHLGCRSSVWTWKGFMICVIICFLTSTVHNGAPWLSHTSCCSGWLLWRLQSFQADLQEFLRPAAEMLQMTLPPHCLHKKTKIKQPRWGWAEACGSQQSGSLTTALVMQTRVSHTTVWQGPRCDRENDSIVHSVHETKMVSLCVGVFIFQALPRAPLFAKTKSVPSFFFFFFFTFRPNINLAFLQTWRISVVITADSSKYSYTKPSDSCPQRKTKRMKATVKVTAKLQCRKTMSIQRWKRITFHVDKYFCREVYLRVL